MEDSMREEDVLTVMIETEDRLFEGIHSGEVDGEKIKVEFQTLHRTITDALLSEMDYPEDFTVAVREGKLALEKIFKVYSEAFLEEHHIKYEIEEKERLCTESVETWYIKGLKEEGYGSKVI